MKKFTLMILFVFCLTNLFGGIFFIAPKEAMAQEIVGTASKTFSSDKVEEFVDYVNNYGSTNYNDNIELTSDIDLAGYTLTNTIGTALDPFNGTFNGNGFEIKNLTINLSGVKDGTTQSAIQNVGLFGRVEGYVNGSTLTKARIENVAITENVSITTGGNGVFSANAGLLVGSAKNTIFQFVQLNPRRVTINNQTGYGMNFGGVVGLAENCSISNTIVRASNFGTWQFSENDNKFMSFGGVVGFMSNTDVYSSVLLANFNVNLNDNFAGTLYLGGVAGQIADGACELYNIAIENSYTVPAQSERFYRGEVAGIISGALAKDAISYIHFKANSGVGAFGAAGSYDVQNHEISATPSSLSLSALKEDGNGGYTYFEQQNWHRTKPYWDFESVWFVSGQAIYLQAFYDEFSISFPNINTNVIRLTSSIQNSYKYNSRVELNFSFVEIRELVGETSQTVDMSKYYDLSSLTLAGKDYMISTSKDSDGNVLSYRFSSGNEKFEIQKGGDSDAYDFKIVIKSVNFATSGIYNIRLAANTSFEISVTTKLFGDDGNLVEGTKPGNVYTGSNTQETLHLRNLKYGDRYPIETSPKLNSPYVFEKWVMVIGDDKEVDLQSTGTLLNMTFGTGSFTQSCEIYAKYSLNACSALFKLDDGIARIRCGGNEIDPTSGDVQVLLSKATQSLSLEIYVNAGYTFNSDEFIRGMEIYKTGNASSGDKEFCRLIEDYVTADGLHLYRFILDMTILGDDYTDVFTISPTTVEIPKMAQDWLWWVIGGSIAAVLLIAIIVIVLVVVLRRRGGGGGSGKSFKTTNPAKVSKKQFKNMYY